MRDLKVSGFNELKGSRRERKGVWNRRNDMCTCLEMRKRIGEVGGIATGLQRLERKLKWEWGGKCLRYNWIVSRGQILETLGVTVGETWRRYLYFTQWQVGIFKGVLTSTFPLHYKKELIKIWAIQRFCFSNWKHLIVKWVFQGCSLQDSHGVMPRYWRAKSKSLILKPNLAIVLDDLLELQVLVVIKEY